MNFFRAISNILRFDRTNWKALTLCFVAASIFWIFNALNKDYATNIRFPLQLEFDQTKYIAVEPLPSAILMNVSGNGWEILRKSISPKVPNISLSLERPTEVHRIVGSTLAPAVASQIGTLQLNYIVTDTLRLAIETKLSRKLKLVPDLSSVSFRDNFGISSPVKINPDSVMLEGPRQMVQRLSDSLAIVVQASRLNSNFDSNVDVLVTNSELISRNPRDVRVSFEVGPMDELVVIAKLELPKGFVPTNISKDSIRCTFKLPRKEREAFLKESTGLVASVEVRGLKRAEVKSFLPSLNKRFSPYTELIHIDSVKVKKS